MPDNDISPLASTAASIAPDHEYVVCKDDQPSRGVASAGSRQDVADENLADHPRPRPKSTNLYLISDQKLDLESASSGHRHSTRVVPPPVGMD